ncbi:MAG: hypothetical protein JO115_08500 [Pseudonocardiales bacterium]|nr:hypothetical protein [Pseudonocardiales bacterium]
MGGKHRKPSRRGALWRRLIGREHQEAKPPRARLNPIVDGNTGCTHFITDDAFLEGLRARTGLYVVLCGITIPAASMVTPPGRTCENCRLMRDVLGGRA